MEKENLISSMNEGRQAAVFLGWASPIFDEVASDILSTMKAGFRSGIHSELSLANAVAQLVALDDLKTKIKGIAVRGDYAAEELQRDPEEE